MALSKVGEVTGGEIVAINRAKQSCRLELDSGEFAVLPFGRLKGDNRQARFGELREGMHVRVLVLETRNADGFGKPFHIVSERLDDAVSVEEEAVETPGVEAKPDAGLVVKFPVGRRVKGPFAHVADGAVIVLLHDGVRARLPLSEMGGMKVTSLRKGVAVSASVLRVDATGVVLSRKVS